MIHEARALKGATIHASDGEIGSVSDLLFDDQRWVTRYLVVDTGGWLSGRLVLITPIAVRQIAWDAQSVAVDLTREQVRNSPDLSTDLPVSRQKEIEYFRYYGYPPYWIGSGLWGAAMAPSALSWPAMAPPSAPEQAATQPAAEGDPHLRSLNEVTGYTIQARDGEIGSVSDALLDDQTWALRYLVIDTGGWLSGRTVLLAPRWVSAVSWEGRSVAVDLPRDVIAQAPSYDPAQPLSRDYEARLHAYYRQPAYWEQERGAA